MTREELEQELLRLQDAEQTIDDELQQCIAVAVSGKSLSKSSKHDSVDVHHHLEKIENFVPCFEAVMEDSKKLVSQIDGCRTLSDRLSAMVRRLDVMQIRAQQALACTEDVINLKECRIGVNEAIATGNLPLAVSYIRQVHDIDEQAARSSDDYDAMQVAEREVCSLVRQEFKHAIDDSNIEGVLKLCPLLQSVGLEKEARDDFLDFLEKSLFIGVSAAAAPINNVSDAAAAYATSLASIFNSAYALYQQYLPLVLAGMEKSYGDVHFIRRLYVRCEKEVSVILKGYMKYRNVKMLTNLMKKEPNKVNPADVHTILDEIALMLQYCYAYAKYMRVLCTGAETRDRHIPPDTQDSVVFRGVTDFDKMTEELALKYYVEGEKFLIFQAFQNVKFSLDNYTMELDEYFYILHKCAMRSVATGSIKSACGVLHIIYDHLSSEFMKQISTLLNSSVTRLSPLLKDVVAKAVKSSAPGSTSSRLVSQGLQAFTLASIGTADEKDDISLILESFNMAEMCVQYVVKLRADVMTVAASNFGAIKDEGTPTSAKAAVTDAAKVKLCLDDFDSCKVALHQAIRVATDKLVMHAQACFKDLLSGLLHRNIIRFDLSFEQFESQTAVITLPKALVGPFEVAVDLCTKGLSETNKNVVVELLAEAFCVKFEQYIKQNSFSFAGALKLEECYRAVSNVFTHASTASLRGKFTRLREVLLVLTSDVAAGGSMSHHESFSVLSEVDVRTISALRIDFK